MINKILYVLAFLKTNFTLFLGLSPTNWALFPQLYRQEALICGLTLLLLFVLFLLRKAPSPSTMVFLFAQK